MTELMGTLRPVKQRRNATSYDDVETIGNITASVRLHVNKDRAITEVLDEVQLPYVQDADGFAIFDEAGEVLTWFPLVAAAPDSELMLRPGWGFSTTWAATGNKKAAAHAGASG